MRAVEGPTNPSAAAFPSAGLLCVLVVGMMGSIVNHPKLLMQHPSYRSITEKREDQWTD